MKKKYYIQPSCAAEIMPKYAMMGMQPSPTDGSQDPQQSNVPKRTPSLNSTDTIAVF